MEVSKQTTFDKVTQSPEALAAFIAGDVLGLDGLMYTTAFLAWRNRLTTEMDQEGSNEH